MPVRTGKSPTGTQNPPTPSVLSPKTPGANTTPTYLQATLPHFHAHTSTPATSTAQEQDMLARTSKPPAIRTIPLSQFRAPKIQASDTLPPTPTSTYHPPVPAAVPSPLQGQISTAQL